MQDLHSLLLRSTTNDTIQLKAVRLSIPNYFHRTPPALRAFNQVTTAQLNKDYYKDPACIPALAHIIADSQRDPR